MTTLTLSDLRRQFYGDAEDELAALQSFSNLGITLTNLLAIQKVKSGDTSRVNTTTETDDPHLVFPDLPIGIYTIQGGLFVEGSTTGDFKASIEAAPTDCVVRVGLMGQASTASASSGSQDNITRTRGATFIRGMIGAGTPLFMPVAGYMEVVTVNTDVSFKWAQNALDAVVPTIVLKGSWLGLQRVS